ncbi:MAG: hypothetical protein JSW39_22790 [Desulfobacterales bacterium]|nr:MAG: hypothetical protein JSW39_22790 [Desulfobacterales bacterium]
MKRHGMIHKRLLGVSPRADVLQTLEERIKAACSTCRFDKAATLEEARQRMMRFNYHLVIVDEVNLKTLLRSASFLVQNFPLVVLTENGRLPADEKNAFAPNVYGFLPANSLERTIPVISELLNIEFVPRWQSPFKRYGGVFNLGTVEAVDKLFNNESSNPGLPSRVHLLPAGPGRRH